MQLISKHLVLAGLVISLLLIIIAASVYPGGSISNEYSEGFDWTTNFISNLFGERAINGSANPARYWAYAAMILLPFTYAVFFVNMSQKIPDKMQLSF